MRSPLDFGNSEKFRNDLMLKNLVPYKKSPYYKTPPFNYEVSPLRDSYVIDTNDKLIDEPIFSKEAYKLNKYGKFGGYEQVRDPNVLYNTKTNYGEYSIKIANALEINKNKLIENLSENYYTTQGNTIDSGNYLDEINYWFDPKLPRKNILHYWGDDAPSFIPSTYTPFGILTNNDETKSNLAADSYITRLGAKVLNDYFKERVGRLTTRFDLIKKFEQTIDSLNDPLDVYDLIIGREPILQPNWSITKPSNLIAGAAQLSLEFVGSELPFPTILGSYFDETISLNGKNDKGFIGGLFNQKETGSKKFYDNMGSGQRSVLYKNINKNLYKPNYDRNGILGSFLDLFTKDKENYYVGNDNLDINDVNSPIDDSPIDQFGRPNKTIVYGPTEISKLYEGEDFNPPTGLNGVTYGDGGGIEGGLTWVSPKYKNNSGKNAGKNGEIFGENSTKQTTFDLTESTNYEFKGGSILDDTQRIINSQPNGANRLKHVGNAIDQVSKVFNDGYKEITKGSRVKTYKYLNPETLVGGTFQEYCRLFTKDSPYMTYERLQKTSGITNEGRRLKSSVINKTYDLSITPRKGNDAKKYMLSIENLAWRTTNMYLDLPECEKGPNGGRIMWFPPYDLKVSDSSSAVWNSNDFLGRPEPVYTYKNTTRTGTLDFVIVVDHPSVLNLITNRVLEKESNSEQINGILASFFAGCLKYDIYDLAKIYNTMTLSELEEIQKVVKEVTSIKDEVSYIKRTVITGNDPISLMEVATPADEAVKIFEKYKEFSFYFDNDMPKSSNSDYVGLYNSYTASTKYYATSELKTFMDNYVKNNFTELNKFITECNNFLKENDANKVEVTLNSSASKPANDIYNKNLSERRSASIVSYLKNNIKSPNFTIKTNNLGENTGVTAKSSIAGSSDITVENCSTFSNNLNPITSLPAMACRRVAIGDVKAIKKSVAPKIEPKKETNEADVKITKQINETKLVETQQKIYKNVSKRVLQKLLTECDYFETIEETNPFIYSNLKEKIKYFSPSFHSTTPEGLNSRLTFLQQCVRPGETIPTIRKDGTAEVRDAKNTAFGVPPVLVLRVGDFYHTKIIPETLTIGYDPLNWDINPEGIGFQPMIAKISLSFKFVGASGLSNAVDKLQNALSFNYYANTEVYDPRAEVTDTSLEDMDKKILDFIKEQEKGTTENFDDNIIVNSYKTIGVLNDVTKQIDYYGLMQELITESNKYISLLSNKIKDFSEKNGSALMFFLFKDMKYNEGVYSTAGNAKFNLFGIPSRDYVKELNEYIGNLKTNIKNNDDDLIKKINNEFYKSKEKVPDLVKINYENYATNITNQLVVKINSLISDLNQIQANYQKVLSKVLVILSKYNSKMGYDGFVDKTGNVFIYELQSYLTLAENVLKGVRDIITNNILYYLDNEVNPKNIISGNNQYSFIYLLLYESIMYKEVSNNFKDEIKIKSGLAYKPNIDSNNLIISKLFDEYIDDLKNKFSKKNSDYSDKLNEFSSKAKSAITSLKTDITLNKDSFIVNYIENTTPDNNTKTIFLNLNGGLNYDKENKTWSINRNDFLITRNKLNI